MSTDDIQQPPNPLQLDKVPNMRMAANKKDAQNPEDVEIIFKKIDEEICSKESECPGPRLSVLQSWIEHLEHFKEVKLSEINENESMADTRIYLQRRRSSTASTVSNAVETISKSEINMILNHERNDTIKVGQLCSVCALGIK